MTSGEASLDDVHEAMTALAVDLVREMADIHRPLDAELMMSHAFGGGLASAIEGDRDWGQADDVQVEAFGPMIEQVAAVATEDALALLRVMTVLGPAKLREHANAQARQVAGAGVSDRPWVPILGRPTLLRVWRFGDTGGRLESVVSQFDYAGREHAVAALIDHELGGGLSDCMVHQGRQARQLRATWAEGAPVEGSFIEDGNLQAVVGVLRTALTRPFCPENQEQVMGLARCGELLRSRTDWLGELAGLAPGL
jgi:hypothetical protein